MAATRPAVLVTGLRQTGKSSLLRHLFPEAEVVSFDRPQVAAAARENPEGTVRARVGRPVIFDEIQNAPELLPELKVIIDGDRTPGRWLLTGSQQFPLMQHVTESLAGRIGIIHLSTLSAAELRRAGLDPETLPAHGGFPETWVSDLDVPGYLDDYVATYLERDLRNLLRVTDLRDFQRFMRGLALRTANLVNLTDLGRDVGISAPTAKAWLAALETSGLVTLLEPYFANLSKRLVKTPKVFFADPGLQARLLGIGSMTEWHASPLVGASWENLVFTELVKQLELVGRRKALFFWRSKDGVEVDFVIDLPDTILLVEAKYAEQPSTPSAFDKVAAALGETGKTIVRVLACPTRLDDGSTLGGVRMWHPLRHEALVS